MFVGSFSSLRWRLLLLVLIAGMPAVGLTLMTAFEQRRSAEAAVERDALRLVRDAAADHEGRIENGRQLLVSLSRVPDVRSGDAEECRELLAGVLGELPQYFNLSVARPNGDTYCSARPVVAANISDRPFFQEVLRRREFVVSDYVLGRASGRPNVTLSYPLLNEAREVTGVLVVGFELTRMSSLIQDAGLPEGSTFTVVDRQGTVLIRYPAGDDWIGKPLPDWFPVQPARLTTPEGVVFGKGADDIERIHAFTHIGGNGLEQFGLASVGIPRSTAFADADRQLARNLGGLAAAALAAVVAAWVGGDLLVLRGVHRLVQATRALSAGDFSVRTGGSHHGGGELAVLARAFDQLAEALATHEVERDESEGRLRLAAEREHAAHLQEVAARRSAEKAESRFRTFVESAPDAIVIVNSNGEIVVANSRAVELFGYQANELLGKPIELLLPERFQSSHLDRRQEYVQNPEVRAMGTGLDLRARRKNGSEFPIEVSLGPLETDTGVLIASVVRDVSDRKAVEQLKAQFVATVSHELRTPLTPIIGIASLLLRTDLTSQQKRLIETVERAGQSLLRIVNDILDFSKIEAGKLTFESVSVDLRAMVEDVVQLAGDRAGSKGLSLGWHVDNSVPATVLADPVRLRQVLGNLVDNAVKFTDNGEVVVWGRLVDESKDAIVVRFDVVDTGIGLSEEAISRLFQPFTQADPSVTRKFGGTGLGLAICAHLVRAMGGDIGVDSNPGQGSTFWFTTRVAKLATAAPHPTELDGLSGVRVLVVDDSAANRLISQSLISAWGADVEVAEDAVTAMRLVRTAAAAGRPFRVAVLDLNLEGIDGIELARLITAEPALANLRLVMLASDHRVGRQQQAAAAGITAFLTKPVRRNRLLEALLKAADTVTELQSTEERELTLTDMPTSWLASSRPRRGHILVVEDSPMNQVVILSMLDQLGYSADAVDDGLAALDALEARSYDAVLMDGQMPRMDGLTTTAEIRRREGTASHVPIIAMTASAMAGDRERFLVAGMDDYLAKPISLPDFKAVLGRWVPDEFGDDTVLRETSSAASSFVGDSTVLDLTALRRLAGVPGFNSHHLSQEVIELFVSEASRSLHELQAAAHVADIITIRLIAHRLRGTSANVGARLMQEISHKLEARAEAGDVSDAQAMIGDLRGAFERTCELLTAYLSSLSSTSSSAESASAESAPST